MNQFLLLGSAFAFTFLIEWPLFALLSRRGFKSTWVFLLLMNLVSWPLLIVAYNYTEIHILLLELGVVEVETLLIFISWRFPWWKALLLAFTLNAASYFLGTPLSEFLFGY